MRPRRALGALERAHGVDDSVGIPPANAAAALAALRKLIAEPERAAMLRQRAAYFLRRCREAGLDTGASAATPVVPVIVGDSLRAAKLSAMLLSAGVNVQPMVALAVPNELARLRFFVACTHTEEELDRTVGLLVEALRELGASHDGARHHIGAHERQATVES
jgi:7-keto-8-aminopelargonate synthetase-like enzyme